MELRHLRYFVAVAEELHFGRAAARLNMSQPPLSRQIQELEEELGFALFVREYHKVELTAAGTAYLAQVRGILAQIDAAKQEAAGIALRGAGQLRIGHGTHVPEDSLSRVIAAFQRIAPHVAIELLEAPSPRVIKALHDKTTDVGFVLSPSATSGLTVKPLTREPLMIALPEQHRLATAPIVSVAQLAHENFVLCRRYESFGFREIVEAVCQDAGFTPRVLQAVETKRTVLDLIAAGLGVSLVQESAATPTNGVRFRAIPPPAPLVESAIAWRDDVRPEVLTLIQQLVEIAERHAASLRLPEPQEA